MNDFAENGLMLFIGAFVIQLLAIPLVLIKNNRRSLVISNTVLIIGLALGLCFTLNLLLSDSSLQISPKVFHNFIRFDDLNLYFLFLVQLIALPTTLYNFSYLEHYISKGHPVRSFIIFYILLMISTQIIVIANQAIFFLISWEIMSMSGYLAMILEKEKDEVQKGSFYYFAASHVIIFVLYVMFFILHNHTGSWFFSDYHLSTGDGFIVPLIFVLSLAGFGIKAGFIPFHFWLPQAHPIAPTVLSAFLSGVLIKMGVYGILRTILFIKPLPEWCGWLMLVISMVTAILGVWYALAQHDIKKLLAYHSVENIGIIGLGIGIGLLGSANNLYVLEFLGYGGALLHTLNHAIFKSLLFIGSGVVYQNLGTRNIELMGGLVHKAKYLAILFLIGSVAISGIPPFNGFISEFIIYLGFFESSNELKEYYPILLLLFVVGLAFVGGLAVACFTKVNSIMFLGCERKKVNKFHITVFDYIPLSLFAALCIIIGIFPQPFIKMVNDVVTNTFMNQKFSSSYLFDIDWLYFTIIFSAIIITIILLFFLKIRLEKKYGQRKSDAWGCGYEKLSPRMQYTASSFADELNTIPKSILVYEKKIISSGRIFPSPSELKSHSKDFVEEKIIMPLFNVMRLLITKIEFLSQTDIRYYIGFILAIIIVYSIIAFLWV